MSIRHGFVIIKGTVFPFLKEDVIFIRKAVNLILSEIVAKEIVGVMVEITTLGGKELK